jgi:hypothetical protein
VVSLRIYSSLLVDASEAPLVSSSRLMRMAAAVAFWGIDEVMGFSDGVGVRLQLGSP